MWRTQKQPRGGCLFLQSRLIIFRPLYWKRANPQGALFVIAPGVSSWLLLEIFHPDSMWRRSFVDEPGVLVESLICQKRRTFGVENFYSLA